MIDEHTDAESAFLLIDLAGLAADRDVLDDALTAHAARTGLLDGSVDPYFFDETLRLPRDAAVDVLVEEARSVWDAAVCRLAISKAEHGQRVHNVRAELALVAGSVAR